MNIHAHIQFRLLKQYDLFAYEITGASETYIYQFSHFKVRAWPLLSDDLVLSINKFPEFGVLGLAVSWKIRFTVPFDTQAVTVFPRFVPVPISLSIFHARNLPGTATLENPVNNRLLQRASIIPNALLKPRTIYLRYPSIHRAARSCDRSGYPFLSPLDLGLPSLDDASPRSRGPSLHGPSRQPCQDPSRQQAYMIRRSLCCFQD